MRAIIVENEHAASSLLKSILTSYCTDVEVLATATTNAEGLRVLSESGPDVVFLDIELDDGKSFDLLDMVSDRDFKVIFTTAYDEYALEAFRYDAVDYILKPYVPKDVVAAVKRVKERTDRTKDFTNLNEMLKDATAKQRITLATHDGYRICEVNNIIRLEASAAYCYVYLRSGDKIMISKPLGEIEKSLPTNTFFRVHTSHCVNKQHVKSVKHTDGGFVEMKDGTQVPLARRRKQEFLNQIV